MAHEIQPSQLREKETHRWQKQRSWQALWRREVKIYYALHRLQTYSSTL